MGKRSSFERVPRDFYPTPLAAVVPLIQHLPDRFDFWEPCAGDGALMWHILESVKGVSSCILASDIEPQANYIDKRDVFETDLSNVDILNITNPPWSRDILHPLITHLSDQNPTWLLFDADWPHTKQAAPYLNRLRKIISVGRLKWIPDSSHTGKDNCCWYLFDKPDSKRVTEFVGRK